MGRNVEGCSEQSGVDPGCRWNLGVGGYAFGKILDRSKEFDVKAIVPGIFKLLFDGIIATNVEHVVDKNRRRSHLLCLLYWTK